VTDDLAAFRSARDRYARSPRGPLALVNAQRVDIPQPVWPVPGEWAPAEGGLTVTASAEDGILVDDVLVEGTVFAAGDSAVVPSSIVFADGKTASIGGRTLRIWDPASELMNHFGQIATFGHSERWVLSAHYTPSSELETAVPGTITDAAGDALPVAGTISTTIDDVPHVFTVVRAGDLLQLIFQDATGTLPEDDQDSSYAMGRFLFLDDPGAEADIELDFNRAVLPPCAFSYQYACPIPPPENRLASQIRAGERHPLAVDGSVLH
jgi:uncharacterized protein (DUF1684 family)